VAGGGGVAGADAQLASVWARPVFDHEPARSPPPRGASTEASCLPCSEPCLSETRSEGSRRGRFCCENPCALHRGLAAASSEPPTRRCSPAGRRLFRIRAWLKPAAGVAEGARRGRRRAAARVACRSGRKTSCRPILLVFQPSCLTRVARPVSARQSRDEDASAGHRPRLATDVSLRASARVSPRAYLCLPPPLSPARTALPVGRSQVDDANCPIGPPLLSWRDEET
jgi:hypothetical protein